MKKKAVITAGTTPGMFEVVKDGIPLEVFRMKYEGFCVFAELLAEKKITWQEMWELTQELTHRQDVPVIPKTEFEEMNSPSERCVSEIAVRKMTLIAMSFNAMAKKSFESYGDLENLPRAIKCPSCIDHPHGVIVLGKPELRKSDDDLIEMILADLERYSHMTQGLMLAEQLYRGGRISFEDKERLSDEIESIDLPEPASGIDHAHHN